MNEDKLLEMIKRSADSCEIPPQLAPQKVRLGKEQSPKKPFGKRAVYGVGVAAAALAMVIVVGVIGNTTGMREHFRENPVGGNDTETAASAAETAALPEEGAADLQLLYRQAEDYDSIYNALQRETIYYKTESGADEAVAIPEEAGAAMDAGASPETGHSVTNVQEQGVDEADVVKTDGKYLYVRHNDREVIILRADGGKLEKASVIQLPDTVSESRIQEFYLTGDQLQIISQRYDSKLKEQETDTYYMDYRAVTTLYTYDLGDRTKPALTGEVSQDGTYFNSRKCGDYVYLFTQHYPTIPKEITADKGDPYGIMPLAGGEALAVSDIYLPVEEGSSAYLLITAVDSRKPDRITDKKAILDDASRIYVSQENIYLQRGLWDDSEDRTAIAKFSFADGKIEGEEAAVVGGTVTDDFAVNEYQGTLRVLTSRWRESGQDNCVYILDERMEIVGRLEGLAENEMIYSARFMGDTAYFVTYRQVDPLFTVDLSDPNEPKIVGELKVTGFSEYLHFYGEDRLLGIGWETDPDTGERKGMKLSMFDISDPAQVKEVKRTVIENIDYLPGEYNYKAFTVDPGKNVIGLAAVSYPDSGESNSSYLVFSYEEGKGFENRLTYNGFDEEETWRADEERGVYINDTFYIIDSSKATAFSIAEDYQNIGCLEF